VLALFVDSEICDSLAKDETVMLSFSSSFIVRKRRRAPATNLINGYRPEPPLSSRRTRLRLKLAAAGGRWISFSSVQQSEGASRSLPLFLLRRFLGTQEVIELEEVILLLPQVLLQV
jgi:hypothetical protein